MLFFNRLLHKTEHTPHILLFSFKEYQRMKFFQSDVTNIDLFFSLSLVILKRFEIPDILSRSSSFNHDRRINEARRRNEEVCLTLII